ncbi:MAG: lysophospholipid acyltransferase family protein [Elusimicrobia bacterium]|nr:lysophospholipid acyltransferase family protein [Elusimicrobiota bacterium]
MKSKKTRHFIEYISLKTVIGFVRAVGFNMAVKVSACVAGFVYYFLPIRKKLMMESLSYAFPDKTLKERKAILKNVYKHFARTFVEIMFFPVMNSAELKEMMVYENIYLIEQALKKGNGAVVLSAHFGNWELTALSFAKRYPLSVIVAEQSNKMVDSLINDVRSFKGFETIYKDNNPFKAVMKALKSNRVVAILADQDASHQGVFVPFFNRLASTAKGPALFALRANCPILCGFGVRQPNGKYIVKFEEIPHPNTGNQEKDVEIIMAAYMKKLEIAATLHPEHWFWFHRRWNTKPRA